MPTQVNVCGSNTTLRPGDRFEFINYQSATCTVSNCSPPLVNSSYTVSAATSSGGSTCPAQVQSNAPTGSYTLDVNCCAPDGHPIVIIQ